jgi:hypothetical protein
MPLFTLIFEYGGGTHISQLRSRDARSAQVAWAKSLKPGEVQRLGEKRLAHFVQEIEQDPNDIYQPVALDGLNNAWCGGTPYGLLTIVKTEPAQ